MRRRSERARGSGIALMLAMGLVALSCSDDDVGDDHAADDGTDTPAAHEVETETLGTGPTDRPDETPRIDTDARDDEIEPDGARPERDPWLRPFSSDSIWNTAIGSDAEYEPADLPAIERHYLEHVYLLRTSSDDPARPLIRNGHWRDRCSGTEDSGRSIHLPDGWQPEEVSDTRTPNNPGAFLQPDGRTVIEVNAMGRCQPDGPLYGEWGAPHQHIIDLYGDGQHGGRGASKLSQLGGPIRHHELTTDQPITHALDLLIWAEHLWWGGDRTTSYRWPATSSDAYAGPDTYRGTNPELRMGSLLAIPPTTTATDIGITTPIGHKLFDALRDYGAYITDDAAWDATYLAVESTAIDTIDWTDAERHDMARLVQHLHIITNNTPTTIGGGGTPRQPPHPQLTPPN